MKKVNPELLKETLTELITLSQRIEKALNYLDTCDETLFTYKRAFKSLETVGITLLSTYKKAWRYTANLHEIMTELLEFMQKQDPDTPKNSEPIH